MPLAADGPPFGGRVARDEIAIRSVECASMLLLNHREQAGIYSD